MSKLKLLYMSIPVNTILTQLKFIGKITTMGEKKVIIYVPMSYHKDVLRNFKGKPVRITLEDAL
jgi:hypothetical protein